MSALNMMSATSENERLVQPRAALWWLICKRELVELWIGGRALNLLILFSVLMSISAFMLATNSELSLFDAQHVQFLALQATITFGLFIGLIIAAESISGERERATLEALLLTPANRRDLVLGKFLAALSIWPAAILVALPYMVALSRGQPVLGRALLWGGLMGSVPAAAYTALGMIVSIRSNSSRTSLFISLLLYLLSLLPGQLPGEAQAKPLGVLLQAVNPLESARQFLQRLLMDGKAVGDILIYLIAPILVTLLLIGFLFVFVAPRLGLDADSMRIKGNADKKGN